MLSLVSPLTNISHFVLHKLNYPANIADFFRQLFPLIIFDVIPEKILAILYRLDKAPDKPFKPQFEQLGYEGTLVITNIGSALLFMILIFVGAPFYYML